MFVILFKVEPSSTRFSKAIIHFRLIHTPVFIDASHNRSDTLSTMQYSDERYTSCQMGSKQSFLHSTRALQTQDDKAAQPFSATCDNEFSSHTILRRTHNLQQLDIPTPLVGHGFGAALLSTIEHQFALHTTHPAGMIVNDASIIIW